MTVNEMLHVRMKHGKGDPQKAADYLLSDKDHTGKTRSVQPEILDGDPNTVAKIASMTTRAHKYASGCLSFRDSEKPSMAQQRAIMKDFEATFLPGLEKDKNYSIAWVSHLDKGNLELNYFLATTELTTGKQLNPFPPGELQQEFIDAWVQNMNHQLGYNQVVADPLKISRSKFEKKILPLKEATSEICIQAKTHQQIRDNLEEIFKSAIDQEEIKNRQDIINILKEHGDITRVGDKYISFKPEGELKAIRLKGSIFEEGADYQAIKQQSKEFEKSKNKPTDLTPDQFKANREKIDRLKQSRHDFFKKQYQPKEKKVRIFGPKSMQAKTKQPAPLAPQQQTQQQPQNAADPHGVMAKLLVEVRQEIKQGLKQQEQVEKLDNKKQQLSKPSDPILLKSTNENNQSKSESFRPAISSFSQVATSSRAALLTVQIGKVLFSKLNLELQLGALSIFKESDIKKIFLIKQKIAELDQQIAVLKAQQEQAAESELIQQNAARFKQSHSLNRMTI